MERNFDWGALRTSVHLVDYTADNLASLPVRPCHAASMSPVNTKAAMNEKRRDPDEIDARYLKKLEHDPDFQVSKNESYSEPSVTTIIVC